MSLRKLIINGNDFDQKYADYAWKYFPKYEEFWAKYVGCNSLSGRIARELIINGIEDSQDILRKLIWQWNYTIFLNYIHLDELSKNIPSFTIDRFTELERIHLLSTHLYYTSIECLIKIKNKLSLAIKGKKIEIQGYRFYRNMLAHNVRPFVRVNGNEYFVVDPNVTSKLKSIFANNEENKSVWTDELINQNINFISLNEAIEFLKSKLNEGFNLVLEKEINKFIEMGFPQIDEAPDPQGSVDRYGKPIASGMDFFGRSILPDAGESV